MKPHAVAAPRLAGKAAHLPRSQMPFRARVTPFRAGAAAAPLPLPAPWPWTPRSCSSTNPTLGPLWDPEVGGGKCCVCLLREFAQSGHDHAGSSRMSWPFCPRGTSADRGCLFHGTPRGRILGRRATTAVSTSHPGPWTGRVREFFDKVTAFHPKFMGGNLPRQRRTKGLKTHQQRVCGHNPPVFLRRAASAPRPG